MFNAGLVLEGGAMRGLFTAGVLDLLLERDIEFSYVVSVSAGTCNAFSFITKQIGRTKECMFPSNKEDEWLGTKSLLHCHRLMDIDKIFFEYPYKQSPFRFDKYFASNVENEVVVTSLGTGKAEYLTEKHNEHRLSLIGSASCSMPIIAHSVDIDGKKYYDGGVSNSIPFKRALSKGYDKIVVVLTRPYGKYPSLSPAIEKTYKALFHKHPQFLDTILSRNDFYKQQTQQLIELEKQDKAFVIRPEIPEIDRMESDNHKKLEFYQHGYNVMTKRYNELIEYLEK